MTVRVCSGSNNARTKADPSSVHRIVLDLAGWGSPIGWHAGASTMAVSLVNACRHVRRVRARVLGVWQTNGRCSRAHGAAAVAVDGLQGRSRHNRAARRYGTCGRVHCELARVRLIW